MRFSNCLFMTFSLLAALFVVLLGGTGAAQAQSPFGEDGPHIIPQLVAESATPAPGSTVLLAIALRPKAGWHGYWVNPGDAGLGMDARWAVPAGASVGTLRYPAPQRLLVSGLMNHVYEGPYALLAELRLPPGAKAGQVVPVALDARWLACTDKICVPEQAKLSLSLTIGDGAVTPDARQRFDGYRAALPRPLGSEAHYTVQGNRLRIAIPYPAAAPVTAPWFYAETKDLVAYAAPQDARRVGDMLVIETGVAPAARPSGAIEGVLTAGPGMALALTARPGPVPTGGVRVGEDITRQVDAAAFLLALAGALLGGLLLNVMPCVFPILSLKAISLAKAGGEERQVRREAIAYALGALLSCMALGGAILALRAAGTSVGWAFQLQDNRVIALLLVLVVAITANLAGLFALPALDGGRQGKGVRGAFLTGVLAAFVATPCTGPFMAAAMGAAILMPWPLAVTIFAGLGLGLASPFLALAYIPSLRRRLPRPGPWMEWLRRIMAVPMALTALALGWLLWRQGSGAGIVLAVVLVAATFALFAAIGRGQRRGMATSVWGMAGAVAIVVLACAGAMQLPAPRPAESVEGAVPFSTERLATLRAEKRPVFLYFTADWCVTCKVNEASAIATDDVRAAFAGAGVAVMVGDWTRGDPVITRFLETQGRSGVPLYLYYAPGADKARPLPQLLTPATLTELVKG
ncbi:thioredoxin family protein [Sphingobium sufflavum]|uniref:protein-disulfide reductase DsbD family protein n=1 Tax=Sphingobium sufflavum TaxID=1129547 RepID=UPI001F413F74|nr:protein-disulfide reductase DsbD domain-containing protein [Sphingobium sufflavum]MCE7798561.1 thioredoxin family protein [Sphingobium sufflavum]